MELVPVRWDPPPIFYCSVNCNFSWVPFYPWLLMMIAAIHQVHQTGWKKKNENKDAWSTSWINQGPPSPSSSIKDRCPHSQFLKSLFFSAAVFVLVFASLRQSTSEKQKQKKDQSDLDLDWICFSSLFQWGVGYSDKSNRAIFFFPPLYIRTTARKGPDFL